jgi:hypothetical protein
MSLAFQGAVEFELRLRVFGSSFRRLIRARYSYTPDWPYFDPRSQVEVSAPSECEVDLYFQGARRGFGHEGNPEPLPEWHKGTQLILLGIITPANMPRLEALIDTDARYQDECRRHAAFPDRYPDPGPKL